MEELRQFHLKQHDGSALCGAPVYLRPDYAFATHAAEVTCRDCLRLVYLQTTSEAAQASERDELALYACA